ncbi:hypothetical protein N431DRAFT_234296 [Stipitochalara longipes BDJ]|nr:hypothetical protein N431DRAFT_234296 [Stipitochalara longipes BDJ]
MMEQYERIQRKVVVTFRRRKMMVNICIYGSLLADTLPCGKPIISWRASAYISLLEKQLKHPLRHPPRQNRRLLDLQLLITILLWLVLDFRVLIKLFSGSGGLLLAGRRSLLDCLRGCLRDSGRSTFSCNLARTGSQRQIVFLLDAGNTVADGAMVLETQSIRNTNLVNL